MIKCKIFLIFLCFILRLNATSIQEIVKKISEEDQKNLKYLFHSVFLEQEGAYTLFGDKPVSMAGDFLIPSWRSTIQGYIGILGNGWKTWEKYKHLFPIRKYIIVSERYQFKKSGIVSFYIFVINKKKFIDVINKNIFLFEKLLNRKINPEQMLFDIETGKSSVYTSINRNETLLGILLGYGAHNASLYGKKIGYKSYGKGLLKPIPIKLQCSDETFYPMMILHPVQYSADLDHPETKALQRKYRELRGKISQLYAKGDLLEITLSKLISNQKTNF